MSYSREVLYLQTKEGEGVGYVKREQNGARRRERMVFTGFPQTGVGEYQGEISYVEEEPVLFHVMMQEGRGEAPLECMGQTDKLPLIAQISLAGIVIYENPSKESAHEIRAAEQTKEEISYYAATEPEVLAEPEKTEEVVTAPKESVQKQSIQEQAVREEMKETDKLPKKHIVIGSKWEHICSIYPRKEPFGDGKQFVRIGLEDFVILSESSYKLAQNSFLLHGYYNYGYLVLYRNADGNYYIGTPGTFYEKEKEVAILYDFTHFECKGDEAKEGTFGYYMIPVKL